MKKLIIALLAFGSTSALAADFSGSLSVTSEYMSRGTSQNLYHDPAVMGSVTATEGNLYLTAFAANVNFAEGTEFEFDVFAGYKQTINKWTFDVGLASINYPYAPTNWNFIEWDVKVDRTVGKGSIGTWIGYTEAYFREYGPGLWTEVHGSYPLTGRTSISVSVAKQQLNDGWGYKTFNVGLTTYLSPTVISDIRYWKTNKPELDPVYNSYSPRMAVTLTKLF